MSDPVPPTVQELQAKIDVLEKRIAQGGGELEARVLASMKTQLAELETKLTKAKEAAAEPAPRRRRLLDELDALDGLF